MASTGEPHGLFWDDDNGDREYNAASMEYWLKKFFTTGVFEGDLQVKASSGMTLVIEPGYCNVDGKVKFWNGEFNLTLQAANSTYPRIDTIVITRDNVNRDIVCEVVTGSYSADTPQPTAPVRTSEIYQIVLAQIYVGTGVTEITQANITDTRPDNDLCGYIAGTVEQMDFSQFTAQFEAFFNEFKATELADFSAWELAQKAAYTAWFNLVKQQQIDDKASWDAWYADLQEELHNLPQDTAEYLQIEIDELKESGLSGSILHITTVNSELESKTITVTGGYHSEERTGEFDENLECEIAGIKSVGTVTVTSTDGIRTATSVINIPYYGYYNVPIAFWAATVNIQGDENLYGATVTVKDSDDLTVGTVTLSAVDGTGTFTATKADTYTFSVTYQGQTITETLAVTEETTYSVSLSAGFSWQGWVDSAQYLDSSNYNDLDEVLEDEKALRELFLEHNCVDYLADISTASADVTKILNTDLAAKWINNSDYALDTLSANAEIKAVMDEADKYGYGEWALQEQVPTMTSNTAPYGEAGASSISATSNDAYKVFDGNDSSEWAPSGTSGGEKVYYHFTKPIVPKMVTITIPSSHASRITKGTIIGSNDGNTWAPLGETATIGTSLTVELDNDTAYSYVGLECTTVTDRPYIGELQIYAYAPKGCVPKMTSNSAPYGEAFGSSIADNTAPYYGLFAGSLDEGSYHVWASQANKIADEYVGYKFTNPTCVKSFELNNRVIRSTNTSIKDFKLQASNDGTTYVDLGTYEKNTTDASQRFTVDNDNYYLYYRIYVLTNRGGSNVSIPRLQFYGRQLSVSVPVMTSNTAPFGEVSAITQYDNWAPWYSFNNTQSSKCGVVTGTTGSITYKFPSSVKIKRVDIKEFGNSSQIVVNSLCKDVEFYVSDDGTNFDKVGEASNTSPTLGKLYTHEVTNPTDAKYFRVVALNNNGNSAYTSFGFLQFYGLDYSEKEFEAGTAKKWLYDHGVELETMTPRTDGTNAVARKDDSELYFEVSSGSSLAGFCTALMDLTTYSLLRAKVGDICQTNSNVSSGTLAIFNTTTPTYNTSEVAYESVIPSGSNLPNNKSLDISSLSTNYSVSVCSSNGSSSATRKLNIKELWLEE